MASYLRKTVLFPLLALVATSGMARPTAPLGRMIIHSVLDPRVSVSYKETQICETTPGVKSYSGYVNLPANASDGRAYDIHTFFWFFEARNNPTNAPLSIWLQGGPGSPSTPSALGENGPCYVIEDSKTTKLNPWSWNNDVSMLYIDQPVQTGFSYDTLINGTIDEIMSPVTVMLDSASEPPQLNSTTLAGVFSSQNPAFTANTTATAARAAWYFMQSWIKEFPQYKPDSNKFSIWGESYGGHYGPTFAEFFEEQNDDLPDGAVALNLDTVGVINGCIDMLIQMPFYPEMAFNNTYGLKIINETQYQSDSASFATCQDMLETCRSMADNEDPLGWGNNVGVNAACQKADNFCVDAMTGDYAKSGLNFFDIAAPAIGAFPPKYVAGYLNTEEVQRELGVPLNFTALSISVAEAFDSTGDDLLGNNVAALGKLLDRGIKVALVYGDRDYQCNWLAGEAISLAIQANITSAFHQAGYTEIHTNETYVGGMVRQHGNLSFSRVYEAGHTVAYYQPETAFQIFNRVMFNTDVAAGNVSTVTGSYSSAGPANVFDIKNTVPPATKQECYFWDMFETCTESQKETFRNGTAITKNFILIDRQQENDLSSAAALSPSVVTGLAFSSFLLAVTSFTYLL